MREGLCAAGATNVQIAQRTQGGRGPGKKPSVGRVCGEGVNTVCSHQSQPAPWGRGPLPPNPHGSPAARAQGVTSPRRQQAPSPPIPSLSFIWNQSPRRFPEQCRKEVLSCWKWVWAGSQPWDCYTTLAWQFLGSLEGGGQLGNGRDQKQG